MENVFVRTNLPVEKDEQGYMKLTNLERMLLTTGIEDDDLVF